jgi:hypothetical protein
MYSDQPTTSENINYDSAPLIQLELDGIEYRVDAGKQGTALSISTREAGTYGWAFGGEGRWDGSDLRAKAFERAILRPLSVALKDALADLE